MLAPRLVRHYWTDDEFNLLARCRAHHWTFDRIQKTHFPSLTKRAVFLAHSRYKRFRVKEHSFRTSLADTSATTPRSISRRGELTRSNPVPESSSSSHTTPPVDSTVEASRSPISRRQNNSASATTIRTASRYNLRPSKSKSFQRTESRVVVDCSRFPHFSESFKNYLKSREIPDNDYTPPSRSPTLRSSDRSPSVISSHISEASSSELFGLETRSLLIPDCDPPASPSETSETPSQEFFNCEEQLPIK